MKNWIAVSFVVCSAGLVFASLIPLRRSALAPTPRSTRAAERVESVSGVKIRLVAVADPNVMGNGRIADHAWTPDGLPFEGPEARLSWQNLSSAPAPDDKRRAVFFELEFGPQSRSAGPADERPTASDIDVYGYLERNASPKDDRVENPSVSRPLKVSLFHGVPRDSDGHPVLAHPCSVTVEFGAKGSRPQPVVLGFAEGPYQDVASVPVSMPRLGENQSAIMASGPWGRIEVTHLPLPTDVSHPAPTHRLRLLGGAFPPKFERRVLFLDSKGAQMAACGDGPNNAGYPNRWSADVARMRIQERPYAYAHFEGVSFEPQSSLKGHYVSEGLDQVIDSPIGRVLGVLKSTKDGPWMGYLLYAADGVRWRDPSPILQSEEYGMFDPWNHPMDDRRCILFEPKGSLVASKTPSKCEVFAADSPDGPDRERLTSWDELPLRLPMSTIAFSPTARAYVRLDIRVGGGVWRTVQSVRVPDEMLRTNERAAPGAQILEVRCYDDGRIKVFEDLSKPSVQEARWQPKDQIVRCALRLTNGDVVEALFNVSGYGASRDVDAYRGISFTKQRSGTLVQSGFKSVDLKEIAAVDIQVQDLEPRVVIPLRPPRD